MGIVFQIYDKELLEPTNVNIVNTLLVSISKKICNLWQIRRTFLT